jgi:hypothetical protein
MKTPPRGGVFGGTDAAQFWVLATGSAGGCEVALALAVVLAVLGAGSFAALATGAGAIEGAGFATAVEGSTAAAAGAIGSDAAMLGAVAGSAGAGVAVVDVVPARVLDSRVECTGASLRASDLAATFGGVGSVTAGFCVRGVAGFAAISGALAGAGAAMSALAIFTGSLGASDFATPAGLCCTTGAGSLLRCWSMRKAPPSTLAVMTPIAIPKWFML